MLRLTLLALLLTAGPLTAQTAQPVSRASRSITATDVARRINIIAHDSMMGRDTPSRGLDLTAQYVVDQFRRFGLKSSLQRYPITRRRLDPDHSRIIFSAGSTRDSASFRSGAKYEGGTVPERPLHLAAMLVGGAHTSESAAQLEVRGKAVLFVPPAQADRTALQQVLRALFLAGPEALVILSDADSAGFANTVPKDYPERTVIGLRDGSPVTLQVHPSAVRNALSAAGVDLPGVRSASTPIARELSELRVGVEMKDT
ncbi:MAG TPA: hypothetical protein VFO71_09245, partial [Gemmatimonadales bacterium]|nr:hypothetical protein [Gemmatimonadales bacterium]